jgi:hypothetical protein
MKIFLRFATVLLCLVCFSNAFSQNTANYTFTTATNASLTDMTGATQIIVAGSDDVASSLQTIPFNFLLMGVNYTQFSANSNGFVRLGGTAVATGQYTLGTAANTLISSFGSDEITQTTGGGVFYKVTGSAPNRVLVVEFRNMTVIYDGAGATGDATSQVRLYEGTGVIELVYGAVNRNSSTGFQGGMEPQYVGFSTGSASGTVATITTSTGTVSTTAATSNQYTLGAPVAELTSAADGSRRIYTFTPPVPADPTNLNFTSVGASSMTLNWTDNATNELSYLVYKSTDGGVNYSLVSTLPAGSTSSAQGGLSPSTTYFWRVIAASEGALSAALSGSQATTGAGNIVSNGTGGGLWSLGSTWAGGVPPTSGDNVTISAGDVVTLDQTSTILGLTVSGTLQYEVTTARTLNVGLDLNVNFASFLNTGASGSVTTHVLAVTGNIINNGSIDLSIGTAGTVLNFNGSANSTYSGTLGTNDLYSLTLTKSSRAQIVELNLPAFSVRGLSAAATGALLTSGSGTGTLKISGTNIFTGTLWSTASYTIPATLGFWLNNPNFTVNAQAGSPTLAGLFRISAGTYNIGTATGNSMGFSGGSVITVEGGAINVTGRFGVGAAANIITYTQTGGVITVCTIGNTSTTLGSFDLGTSTSSAVAWSAGTVVVQTRSTAASGPRDFRYQSGSGITALTGTATLQLGNAASGVTPLAFSIRGVLPNLVLTNTSANHTCTIDATVANYNCATRNFTISTGTTLTLLNNFVLFAGTSIVNNGVLTGTGASCRFITFEPGTNISYSGTGTVTAPLNSLELQNDGTVTIDPASPNIVCTRIIIFSGSFVNANKLTVGNGGSTTGSIQIGNTTTPTTGGTFDVSPTFNLGTGGQNISCLRTTTPITLNTIINPTRILNNLTIDPDVNNTVTLAGGNLQINTTLTLTTGYFNLGGNMLTLGSSAASTGTMTGTVTNVINGDFKRWMAASTGTIVFPIGAQVTTDRIQSTTPLASSDRFYSPSTEEYAGTVGYTVSEENSDAKDIKVSKTNIADSKVNGKSVVNKGGNSDSPDAVTNYTRTASINFTVAPSVGGTLTAQWISTPGGNNGLPLSEGAINITGTSDDGYWSIVAGDGLTGGTYDATFTATGIAGVTDYTQLVLLKRANSSSPWTLDGTHVTTTGSNSAPVLSRTGITSGFSEFIVGGDPNPLPVELSSFVSSVTSREVKLNWATTSEHNNSGFDIERKANGTETWNKVGFVAGTGNSNTPVNYSYLDRNLNTGKYDYRLKQVDYNGNYAYYNLASYVEIGVPGKFAISQNYPNPFNPTTKINYDLPFDSKVSIKLFDMSGKEVSSLVNNAALSAGYYTVQFNGANLASGIYFYTISAQGPSEKFVSTKKMVLVK